MELLAPAGNLEAGLAAFHYGADAVYLGMRQFSARADAGNFAWDDLSLLLGIAHQRLPRRRKVYVAINTLLKEEEIPALLSMLVRLRELGVDALIIQDLAVLNLVREHFPEFVLHASTQLSIHDQAGARQALASGFQRVIAARELTLSEIEQLSAVPNMEVEVFVHGALCYSYSGFCLLSGVLHGTSGNRGECSYVCRRNFQCRSPQGELLGTAAPLSMNDLALKELLPALCQANVTSLKIEGRKKTPLYVAAATNLYRRMLDQSFTDGEEIQAEKDLQTIFSRPWTQFHLRHRRATGVTDPMTSGPRGVPVGTVATIRPGQPEWLRFVLQHQRLEKHDGLQIEIPGRTRPYGFAVEAIRIFPQANVNTWNNVFTAEPGVTVEVPLPEDCPEIPAQAKICHTSSQSIKQRYQWPAANWAPDRLRKNVYFDLNIAPQQLRITSQVSLPAGAELPATNTTIALTDKLTAAKKPELVEEAVNSCFAKLGDTDLALAGLRVNNLENLFVPVSLLNEARRQAVRDIENATLARQEATLATIRQKVDLWRPDIDAIRAAVAWSLKVDRAFYLNAFSAADLEPVREVIFALDRCEENQILPELAELERLLGSRNRIRLALPVICRSSDSRDWRAIAATLLRHGWRRWLMTHLGSMELLMAAGARPGQLHWTADWSMYTCNRLAAKELLAMGCRRVTLSPEDTFTNWRQLLPTLGAVAELPVYQDTALAISAVCAQASLLGSCPGKSSCDFTTMYLTNAGKVGSPKDCRLIAVNNFCNTVIINERPLDLSNHLKELKSAGAKNFRADFVWRDYSPVTVRDIWRRLQQGGKSTDAWTANFLRTQTV